MQFIVHAKRAIKAEVFRDVSMEEAMASDTHGPIPPAIKLFDAAPEDDPSKQWAGGKVEE